MRLTAAHAPTTRRRVRVTIASHLVLGLVAGLLAALGASLPVAAEQAGTAVRRTAAGSIAAGNAHTCALLTTGAVRCWGEGADGRLGYGNTDTIGDDETPATQPAVPVGGNATAIAAGSAHTCALLTTGAVRCWGAGADGRLGYGNTSSIGDDETPASAGDVPLGGKAIAIAAGVAHTCALLTTRALRCWGDGGNGRLGYGNTDSIGDDETPSSQPVVPVGGRVDAVAAGGHTCAVLTTGRARCWGFGGGGRLGYGNTDTIGDDETPASAGDVPVGERVTAITTGAGFTCALLTGAALRCWGLGGQGRLGYGNTDNIGDDEIPATQPVVPIGGRVTGVAAGAFHACAVLSTRVVRCWGSGDFGQLGYGNTTSVGDDEFPDTAGDVSLDGWAEALTADGLHTCAVLSEGGLRCWGFGEQGRLGYGYLRNVGDNEEPATSGDVVLRGKVRVHGLLGIG